MEVMRIEKIIRIDTPGDDHDDMSDTFYYVGLVYVRLGLRMEAIKCLQEVVRIRELSRAKDDPAISSIMTMIDDIHKGLSSQGGEKYDSAANEEGIYIQREDDNPEQVSEYHVKDDLEAPTRVGDMDGVKITANEEGVDIERGDSKTEEDRIHNVNDDHELLYDKADNMHNVTKSENVTMKYSGKTRKIFGGCNCHITNKFDLTIMIAFVASVVGIAFIALKGGIITQREFGGSNETNQYNEANSYSTNITGVITLGEVHAGDYGSTIFDKVSNNFVIP